MIKLTQFIFPVSHSSISLTFPLCTEGIAVFFSVTWLSVLNPLFAFKGKINEVTSQCLSFIILERRMVSILHGGCSVTRSYFCGGPAGHTANEFAGVLLKQHSIEKTYRNGKSSKCAANHCCLLNYGMTVSDPGEGPTALG